MPSAIVIASSRAEQRELMRDGIEPLCRSLVPPPDVLRAICSEEAMLRLAQVHDPKAALFIVDAELEEIDSVSAGQCSWGVDLVRKLQQEAEPPACILICERFDQPLFAAAKTLPRCEAVIAGATNDLQEQLQRAAEKLNFSHAVPPHRTDEPYALIEVDLPGDPARSSVHLVIENPEQSIVGRLPLNLPRRKLQDVIERSRQLRHDLSKALSDPSFRQRYMQQWHEDYKAVGHQIFNLLATRDFTEFYGMARMTQNVRFRFNLDRSAYDALWEAIFDARHDRFLMLDDMIARRAAQSLSSSRRKLGSSDGVLHVLGIPSDVRADTPLEGPEDELWQQYWGGLGVSELEHLDDEMEVLRGLRAQHGIGVEILPPQHSRERWSLADDVERLLTGGGRSLTGKHFDIVHFAGHALFDPAGKHGDRRGYLVFAGRPKARAVPIAKVARWLAQAGVELIYLSCCRSSAPEAAFELAGNNMPMTIGFSWDLDDGKAVDFARTFYAELLTARLKVCPAFLETRRKLYSEHKHGDPIWASPVFIAQSADWERMETGLCGRLQ
jgi:hypothetical protein